MPYRSTTSPLPRLLVVRNEPVVTAILSGCTGVLFTLLGGLISSPTNIFAPTPGGEVVMNAMATVFVLVGVTLTVLGICMQRCQTQLTLVREELTVTVRTSAGAMNRRVVRVEDIEHVGLEVDDGNRAATYRAQIVVRGEAAIALGEVKTSSRGHYERVAAEIRHFIAAG